MSNRRTFLKQAGLLAASLPMMPHALAVAAPASLTGQDKWRQLRTLFPQAPEVIHLSISW